MVSVQKKSEAQVHQFQPKLTPPQKAAVERNLDADERALLKAEKSASLHKGALYGAVAGVVFGMALNIVSNTSLIDQVGSIWASRDLSERLAPEDRR